MSSTIPTLTAFETDITEEVLDPNLDLPQSLLDRIQGEAPGPWAALAEDLDPAATDGRNALAVRRHCRFDPRTASDPAVWHLASLVHHRDYVTARWGASPKIERILGGVRRNAIARLWWMGEALDSDGRATDDQIVRAIDSTSRVALWLIDFNGFHGRPWLARAVVDHLVPEGGDRPSDARVDAFFKALGQISAVRVLEMYEDRPQDLLDLVEVEIREGAEPAGKAEA